MDHRDRQALGQGRGVRGSSQALGSRANVGLAQSQSTVGKGFRGKHRERQGVAAACLHQATYATVGEVLINL